MNNADVCETPLRIATRYNECVEFKRDETREIKSWLRNIISHRGHSLLKSNDDTLTSFTWIPLFSQRFSHRNYSACHLIVMSREHKNVHNSTVYAVINERLVCCDMNSMIHNPSVNIPQHKFFDSHQLSTFISYFTIVTAANWLLVALFTWFYLENTTNNLKIFRYIYSRSIGAHDRLCS